jgi:hypothetical protein
MPFDVLNFVYFNAANEQCYQPINVQGIFVLFLFLKHGLTVLTGGGYLQKQRTLLKTMTQNKWLK